MKKIISLYSIMVAFIMIAGCTRAPKSDEATVTEAKKESKPGAGEAYKVDTGQSRLEWIGTKVSGYHTGTIKIKSGSLTVSNGAINAGNFVMDMNTVIATGPPEVSAEACKKLTGHLHSPDFFDVEKFPEGLFVITSVKPFTGTVNETNDARQEKLNEYKVANPTHTISGNLTIKGIEKNIEFPAQVTVSDNAVEAKAKFNIDRKQWNISYAGKPDDLIRDEVNLGIFLKAAK